MTLSWYLLRCGLISLNVCLAAEISAYGKHTYVHYIMKERHAALVCNLQTCCKSNLTWLRTGWLKLNCHWEYFPVSGLCLPLSPTHPPAQPSCPAMFCPLLSRVNTTEIAQLPTLPASQNAIDVTAGWGAKLFLWDYCFICSGPGHRLGLGLTTEAV